MGKLGKKWVKWVNKKGNEYKIDYFTVYFYLRQKWVNGALFYTDNAELLHSFNGKGIWGKKMGKNG